MNEISKSLLQDFAKLKQKKFRDKLNLYIVSGLNAVNGCLDSGKVSPKAILIQNGREHLLADLPGLDGIPAYTINPKDFNRISDEKMPQGIAVVLEKPNPVLSGNEAPTGLVIYLEQINDPGNLGTIIRSAAWFGVRTLLLSPGSVDPYQPKAVRASAGYITSMDIYEQFIVADLKQFKEANNYLVAGMVVEKGKAINSFEFPGGKNYLLAFGSEAHGLSDSIKSICDYQLTIPRVGEGESLNLSVSLAVTLYALTQS